jgi:butyryl-CoA dehydrogenase
MDFNFTPDQLALKKMVQEFTAKEITPYALEMDKNGGMQPGLIQKFDEAGLLNLVVPEEYDGPGLDTVSIALIYEELGKGCAGVATSVAANALASYPVLLLGTRNKKIKCSQLLTTVN